MGLSLGKSRAQHERARRSMAGGVATAFRASQEPFPISFTRGAGARITDIDGNSYVDFALGFGPLLLGHSPGPVLAAVRAQLALGLGYGASHPLEPALAEAVCRTVPSAELCVFSSTGSEAVHAALRIARAATGRSRVIKFHGHYHGWFDPVHIGLPGSAEPRTPGTAGQDPGASAAVTVCDWNDLPALAGVLGSDVAAVIMEPIAVNGGCLMPSPGYLEGVREMTSRAGALLIFDEVITGYRLALGGAQQRLGVLPDLTVLGKALGAGFPISAVCGRADVLSEAATGRVAHVGTFNANPVCASAALAAVTELERRADELYPQLEHAAGRLAGALRAAAAAEGVPLVVNQEGAAAHAFSCAGPVTTYRDTLRADPGAYRFLAGLLLQEGVHVIPRGLLYVSTAHDDADMTAAEGAIARAMACAREAAHGAPPPGAAAGRPG
jgi:glutamate-1-semialdehyde 2,1-aminomutase